MWFYLAKKEKKYVKEKTREDIWLGLVYYYYYFHFLIFIFVLTWLIYFWVTVREWHSPPVYCPRFTCPANLFTSAWPILKPRLFSHFKKPLYINNGCKIHSIYLFQYGTLFNYWWYWICSRRWSDRGATVFKWGRSNIQVSLEFLIDKRGVWCTQP